MFGRLAAQESRDVGRHFNTGVPPPGEKLHALGRKQFVYGMQMEHAQDWVTAAKNVGKWPLDVERGGGGVRGGVATQTHAPIGPPNKQEALR